MKIKIIVSTLVKHVLLVLLLFSFYSYAQKTASIKNAEIQKPSKIICFGEKVNFGTIENSVQWTISNANGNIFTALSGNQINDYVFEKAGVYEVRFLDNTVHREGECNHAPFNALTLIQVNPIKMVFDFSKITFSKKIQVGVNSDAIFITVPIVVSMKENTATKFRITNAIGSGVGVQLIAKPTVEEIEITNGVYNLTYQLSGIVNNEAYLMFDFVDINNQVQTYNHLEIIK
jgi:hypothetical protein